MPSPEPQDHEPFLPAVWLCFSHFENQHVDMNPGTKFIESLCSHLDERFPKNDVQDWSTFVFSALSKTCALHTCSQSPGVWQSLQTYYMASHW